MVGPYRQYYIFPYPDLRHAYVIFEDIFREALPRYFNRNDVEVFLDRESVVRTVKYSWTVEQYVKPRFDAVLAQLLEVHQKRQTVDDNIYLDEADLDDAELEEWN